MNQTIWKQQCKTNKSLVDFSFYNRVKSIQKSLQYNKDPKAVVIHHLRDTEEQRKYNDEHYELWGFEIDENGNEHFEYGKYVIFVTKEEHTKIHKLSEETRKKISASNKGKYVSEETRKKISETWMGHVVSEETRKKMSENRKGKGTGESNHNYGKSLSEETKKKISESRKGKCSGDEHWLYGKQLPEDIKQRISKTHKENMTEERRKLISETTKAAMATEEVKIRMSESHKGIYPSNEAREKMSISQKASWTDERRKARSENYSGEKSCWYGKHHTEETIEKMKRVKREKRAMFESVKSTISDLTWKLFSSYYNEYKNELRRTPSLEEMYSYILTNGQNFKAISHT